MYLMITWVPSLSIKTNQIKEKKRGTAAIKDKRNERKDTNKAVCVSLELPFSAMVFFF